MFKFFKNKLKEWTKKVSSDKLGEEAKPKKKKAKKIKEEVAVEEEKEELLENSNELKELSNKKIILENRLENLEPIESNEDTIYLHQAKKGFFSKMLSSQVLFTQEDFSKHREDLEMLLLENNVAFEVVDKILVDFKNLAVGKEFSKKDFEKEILDLFKEVISGVLIEPFDLVKDIKESKKPYVVLFCGINGAGKTTTLAKFANFLKKNKFSCVLAAGDTFRAASIEQLKIHAKKLKVPVVSLNYGSDPASVGFEAINYATKNKIDVVLIDTAGRMHTARNLMLEIEKIARVCKPNLKLFVGESISGNDIVSQAIAFEELVSLDGIILAKADIDEKGGSALSVGYSIKKPILFLGKGQKYEDLEFFNKKKFLDSLFK